MDIKRLQSELAKLEDPRRTKCGHIRHKLEDIIIIGLCTLICDGRDFVDMEEFGKAREEWLRKFLELPNGIPDSDTFRRVYERLEPEKLSECLYDWLCVNCAKGSVIAIDGKTICGSGNNEHRAYHVVSAFVVENQITLGEIATQEKSNEITAVPELLESLNIKGSIITADAMSCQKKIVETICTKHADYVISLKENQLGLLADISLYFTHFSSELPTLVTHDKDHGRIEKREYRLLSDLSWQEDVPQWRGLRSACQVTTTITKGEQASVDTRYFISSLNDLNRIAYAIRKHWSVENQLHWCLDVIFDEDASRARKDNSPLNLNVLRKVALVLCRSTDMGKRVSLQKKRFRAALDPASFLSILLG